MLTIQRFAPVLAQDNKLHRRPRELSQQSKLQQHLTKGFLYIVS